MFTLDYLLDTAFRLALVRRVAWVVFRHTGSGRLNDAFWRDLTRQARTPFGRELVRVLTVAAIVRPNNR